MSNNELLIAGQNGGKKINVVPAVKPAFLALDSAAKRGNHWARIAVASLQALSSGRLGKDNIYVRPNNLVVRGQEQFYVTLPGCKATVERLPDDTYKVVDLVLDTGYFEANGQNAQTGLYKADKVRGGWKASFLPQGKLNSRATDQRLVGITDTKYESADEAANLISKLISKAPGGGGVFFEKFDMHYTSGNQSSLGGLQNYNKASKPLTNESIYGSAQMLADTMKNAKETKGVSWVAEFGGAAVLTQAMKILADEGIKLENHTAFLYRPNTNVDEAVAQAHKIGLKLDRKFVYTTAADFMGNRNQVGMIMRRYKAEKEKNYKVGNMCWDLACQATNVQGGVALTTAALGAAGMSIAAPTWPILAAIGSALGLTLGVVKMGDSLVEQFAPRFYNKHIGKIK